MTREEVYYEFAIKANHQIGLELEHNAQAMKLRLKLIKEEIKELFEAVNKLYASEDEDLTELKAEVLKELADCQYVISGFAATFSLELEEAFKRVHDSNMTKFIGKPEFDVDGKVKKGDAYKPPFLEDLVQ